MNLDLEVHRALLNTRFDDVIERLVALENSHADLDRDSDILGAAQILVPSSPHQSIEKRVPSVRTEVSLSFSLFLS